MAYTIALKILGNEEDAEDAAQESFIKAYQQIHQFEGKSKFSTWLYTIVYRTAISKLKENKIQILPISDTVRETYAHEYTTPQLEQLHIEGRAALCQRSHPKAPKNRSIASYIVLLK